MHIDPADGSMYVSAFLDKMIYADYNVYDIGDNILQYNDRIIVNTAAGAGGGFLINSFLVDGAEPELPADSGETTNIFGTALSLFGVAALKLFGIE